MHKHLILVIFLAGLLPVSAYAGWSEDIRLTTQGYEIHPEVIARNDTVHVVCQYVIGRQVSYLRSLDAGYNWAEWIDLVGIGHTGARPDLSLNGENVLVAWFDNDTISPNPFPNVGYAISEGGNNWSPPAYVFPHRFPGMMDLATALNGDSIYAVYMADDRDSTGYFPLRFSYSSNLGQSWSEVATVGHCPDFNNNLRMAKCGGSIYIFWAGQPIPMVGHPEIIGVISHNGGQTWSDVYQLSSDDYHSSQHVCMAVDDVTGKVAVGWMEAGYPGDVHLRITTDGGYNWGDIHQATTHHMVADPSLVMAGDTIWAVWSDRDPSHGWNNCEIAFSQSIDCGLTWSPYERLTFAEGRSYSPWISYDSGKLHMVWWDHNRPPHMGNEIYYKRYTPDPTATFEDRVNPSIELSLKAYPNPFNSFVNLTLNDSGGGEVEISIYDIRGRLIRNLIANNIQGGDKKAVWDATDASGERVSSGIYFAKAKTSGGNRAVKLIYLK